MNRDDGKGKRGFEGKIPIAADVDTVGGDTFKTELFGGPVAIDGKRCFRPRGTSQRAFVGPRTTIAKARSIAGRIFRCKPTNNEPQEQVGRVADACRQGGLPPRRGGNAVGRPVAGREQPIDDVELVADP